MLTITMRIIFITLLLLSTHELYAHSDINLGGGFINGFTHPILGLDHLAAMLAVGVWGAILGKPAIWVLPITFPMVMAAGGALGVMAIPIPSVEIGIAASSLVIGLLIVIARPIPLWIAIIIISFFAILHGHAHGTELPESSNPMIYSAGFVIATGLIHLAGIAIGELLHLKHGKTMIRLMGLGITLSGIYFLLV